MLNFLKGMVDRDRLLKRILMSVLGVVISAFAVGFFKESAFGVDPFQCFAMGTGSKVTFLSYGTYYMLISIVFLIVVFFLDKHYISIATFINLFLTGYMVDLSVYLIDKIWPEPSFVTRCIFLAVGVVVMCIASAIYFTADLGVSVYDAISLHLGDKNIKLFGKVVPFKFWRIFTDLICVLIGILCGTLPGVGTLITAFFMGPLIAFFRVHIAEKILYGKKSED